MKSNRYPCGKVAEKLSLKYRKIYGKNMYQDLYFDNVGGSTPERVQGEVQTVLLRYLLLCGKQYGKYS